MEDLLSGMKTALAAANAASKQHDAVQLADLDRFAESFAKKAAEAASSPEASKQITQIAHEAFLGPRSSTTLLECAMLAVTQPLGSCVRTVGSRSAANIYCNILERMASSCSARDAVLALLAVLDDAEGCEQPAANLSGTSESTVPFLLCVLLIPFSAGHFM